MPVENKRDPLQPYLNGADGLSAAYSKTKQKIDGPPPEVDEAILLAASEQSQKRSRAKVLLFPRRWIVPLAAAATLMLVIGVSQWFGGPAEVRILRVAEKAPVPEDKAPIQQGQQTIAAPRSSSTSITGVAPQLEPTEAVQTHQMKTAKEAAPALLHSKTLEQASQRAGALHDKLEEAESDGRLEEPVTGRKKRDKDKPAKLSAAGSRVPDVVSEGQNSAQRTGSDLGASRAAEYRFDPQAASSGSAVGHAMSEMNETSTYSADDLFSQRQRDARLAAQRLSIFYYPLTQQMWSERLRNTRARWWTAIETAVAEGKLTQAQAELAAFAAVHGADDPEVARQAQRLRHLVMPANK